MNSISAMQATIERSLRRAQHVEREQQRLAGVHPLAGPPEEGVDQHDADDEQE